MLIATCMIVCMYIGEMAFGHPTYEEKDLVIYTRENWHARSPVEKAALNLPVPYVVIHHSYIPAACHVHEKCVKAMKWMQNYHMDDHKWWDIGYNFAVGGDGAVYEGRGWDTVGAHATHFNNVSIGIVLIGDWTSAAPPEKQLWAAKTLIKLGLNIRHIQEGYKLVGHRQMQLNHTECPGEALYEIIERWPHFHNFSTPNPNIGD